MTAASALSGDSATEPSASAADLSRIDWGHLGTESFARYLLNNLPPRDAILYALNEQLKGDQPPHFLLCIMVVEADENDKPTGISNSVVMDQFGRIDCLVLGDRMNALINAMTICSERKSNLLQQKHERGVPYCVMKFTRKNMPNQTVYVGMTSNRHPAEAHFLAALGNMLDLRCSAEGLFGPHVQQVSDIMDDIASFQ